MGWPQGLVLSWMAMSGLMEIAMINKDLAKTISKQSMLRDVAENVAKDLETDAACDAEIALIVDEHHKTFLQSTRNAESNAKWKAVGFIFRVFAIRLVIMFALHSGGFF